MTPTKILIGQILLVVIIIASGLWAATQWAASMLAYQSLLGPPWFAVGPVRFYHPWALFPWWFHFNAYAPSIFNRAGALAAASGFLGCGAAVSGSLIRARQSGKPSTYGSARWASDREVRGAGLYSDAGIFLGSLGSSYLRHDGPEHVMVFAPTRSGKGVGLVIPTLLSWTGSAVIHDIKGENWELTAGWRSRFSHCLLFNPTDPKSAHFNPLLEVRRGENEVRDVQNIADVLVDPVIATNRRVYHVEALSTKETAMSQVSWTYPDDSLLALQGNAASAAPDPSADFSLDALNFDYRIEGDKVAWRPLQAFDDGHQVFIEFPGSILEGEAPPLFVSGEHGEAELVNYRVRGRYYIVDRLFGQAELRLGEKHQRIVRIIRVANGPLERKGS